MAARFDNARPRGGTIIVLKDESLTIDQRTATFNKAFPSDHYSQNEQIALRHMSLYYSWDNVTNAFGNTTGLSYRWVDGAVYDVTFPEGYYEVANMAEYLHFVMRENGHYLLDANGGEVYYLDFVVNPVYYRVTLTSTPVPSALPQDWSNPGGIPLNGLAPQLIVGPTNWGKLVGFAEGSYPATQGSVRVQLNGSAAPAIEPVTSIHLLCDWVNDNRFSVNPSIIASFSPTVPFGTLISWSPPTLDFYDVTPRNYGGIQLRLVDQDYRPLMIKDYSAVQFTIMLRAAE